MGGTHLVPEPCRIGLYFAKFLQQPKSNCTSGLGGCQPFGEEFVEEIREVALLVGEALADFLV